MWFSKKYNGLYHVPKNCLFNEITRAGGLFDWVFLLPTKAMKQFLQKLIILLIYLFGRLFGWICASLEGTPLGRGRMRPRFLLFCHCQTERCNFLQPGFWNFHSVHEAITLCCSAISLITAAKSKVLKCTWKFWISLDDIFRWPLFPFYS